MRADQEGDAAAAPRRRAPKAPAPAARTRNRARTRAAILVAASRRFAGQGYARVTLKEIADDVGVTPAMVVRYFGTKIALFEAVASERQQPALASPDLTEAARSLLRFWQSPVASAPAVALLRSLDLDDGALFHKEALRRVHEPWSEVLEGPDVDLRARLIGSIGMGIGLFALGALVDIGPRPLTADEIERITPYLAALLEVCVTGESRTPHT
jgi:AcrR family transcriptional regulator